MQARQARRRTRRAAGGLGAWLLTLALGAVLPTACGAKVEHAPADAVQQPAAALCTIDGEAFDSSYLPHPTAYLFVGRVCPISNIMVPEMMRIFDAYSVRGIDFKLVYTDVDESVADLRAHLASYGLKIPALLDFGQELAQELGISVTPEVAVVLEDGELAYRGRINDLYDDFGIQRSEPTSHDLRDALDAILRDEDPTPARTEAIGCVLPELP